MPIDCSTDSDLPERCVNTHRRVGRRRLPPGVPIVYSGAPRAERGHYGIAYRIGTSRTATDRSWSSTRKVARDGRPEKLRSNVCAVIDDYDDAIPFRHDPDA